MVFLVFNYREFRCTKHYLSLMHYYISSKKRTQEELILRFIKSIGTKSLTLESIETKMKHNLKNIEIKMGILTSKISIIFLHMHTYKFLDVYNIYFNSCMDSYYDQNGKFWLCQNIIYKFSLLSIWTSCLPFHKLSELFPSILSCWILWCSLLRWSWIFHSPCPNITAEYIPCVMIGARMLSV